MNFYLQLQHMDGSLWKSFPNYQHWILVEKFWKRHSRINNIWDSVPSFKLDSRYRYKFYDCNLELHVNKIALCRIRRINVILIFMLCAFARAIAWSIESCEIVTKTLAITSPFLIFSPIFLITFSPLLNLPSGGRSASHSQTSFLPSSSSSSRIPT